MERTSHRTVTATPDTADYLTRISARGLEVIADEPSSEGGSDLGLRPHELLLGALASCIAITLKMYAARKEWNIMPFKVHVHMDRSQKGGDVNTAMRVEVDLPAGLSAEQRERLLQIAGKCPVHRTLTSELTIDFERS